VITAVAGPYFIRPETTRVSIEINAGEPINILIPILDDNGDPVEIAAGSEDQWSAQAKVRRNALASEVLHEWSTAGVEPNAFVVAGDPGQVRLVALASETTAWEADWPDWTCGFDLEVTEPTPASSPWRICEGPLRLRPQYTR
jgi:hypothetical protein